MCNKNKLELEIYSSEIHPYSIKDKCGKCKLDEGQRYIIESPAKQGVVSQYVNLHNKRNV